jgi:hypothetical protein
MEILAIQAIEGAGLVKHSEILVAVFRTVLNGMVGIPGSCSAWTDKGPYTIGRQRIIIGRKISLMGPPTFELSHFDVSQPAKAPATLRNLAPVHAEGADEAALGSRRLQREPIGSPALVMNPFDLRPQRIETVTNTGCAKTDPV